ncbi:MAG: hypothetical protein ACUVTM_03330 [Candidatus Bathyarchaeia archaeon]
MDRIRKALMSRNILVRTATLWTIGFILMYVSWMFSYRALPEGVLCGKFLVSRLEIMTYELLSTFSRIFSYNLLLVCLPLVTSNMFKVRGLPLGYLLLEYHWMLYGMLLGTNSFLIPSPLRIQPSIDTLTYGVGLYELTAYTLMVAATYSLRIRFRNGVLKPDIQGFPAKEKVSLVTSTLLLAASNLYEAWQIVG